MPRAPEPRTPGPEPRGLLLHTCCAWCRLDAVEEFRRDYGRIAVAFFNPNIHPRAEFEKRLKSVQLLCERLGLELLADEEYGLAPFLAGLYNAGGFDPAAEKPRRCAWCFALRLGRTARKANELDLGAFSTTLLSSPWQLQAELRAAGEAAARDSGPAFDARALVALHGSGRSRLPGGLILHRQRYCGCIFSEAEKTGRKRGD